MKVLCLNRNVLIILSRGSIFQFNGINHFQLGFFAGEKYA